MYNLRFYVIASTLFLIIEYCCMPRAAKYVLHNYQLIQVPSISG